jgi:glycosyltransferase involved in cell wall biosynthesis
VAAPALGTDLKGVRARRYAFVYGVHAGVGGLGVQVENALRALCLGGDEVHAIGPGPGALREWTGRITWHVPPRLPPLLGRWSPLRRRAGAVQELSDRWIGRFAARRLASIAPDLCYAFTQVGLETLRWAAAKGIPSVLESPNGHLRDFRQVYVDETRRWCGGAYHGHPTARMVARVEREYSVAGAIRVSSEWTRRTLAARLPGQTPAVLQQPIDVDRFQCIDRAAPSDGRLQVCFVGSLDLRKGFVYLLRAARRAGGTVRLDLVGGTGDRCCRRLLERERRGVDVRVAPGDPREALARADLFVLPTLEDGSPFAVAEAMSSGLPVITTTSTGAAEWVRPGETGWVVEPASEASLSEALIEALRRAPDLPGMGRQARLDTERRVRGCDEALSAWVRAQ